MPVLLFWAFLHSMLYAVLVPLWQAPDEPSHVEFACLLTLRGWDLHPGDYDPALQQRLIRSLTANNFWPWVREAMPDPMPATFEENPFLHKAARQVGDESPWYYAVLAPICRLPICLSLQVRLMRLVSGVFYTLTVLAVWWAARSIWPTDRAAVVAMTGMATGLPMLAFLGGAVNNDSLTTLLGVVTFGCLVRFVHRLQWRMALATISVAILAAVVKKTAAFLILLAGLACAWLLLRSWRRWRWPAQVAVVLGVLILVAALGLPGNQPAGWIERGQARGWGRSSAAAHTGRAGVRLVQASAGGSARLVQILPGGTRVQVRGRSLRFGAWVRAEVGTLPMRVTIRDDQGFSQAMAEATRDWQWVEVTHTVHPNASDVRVAVAIGSETATTGGGVLDVDDASLTVAAASRSSTSAELLRNGDFELSTRLGAQAAEVLMGTWLAKIRAATPEASFPRSLLYLVLLFPGFWGNFGWLQVPMPLPVYVFLAAVCGLAVAGLFRPGRSGDALDLPPAVGRWLALGLALAVVQIIVLPMWGRDWQPQARYLYPALMPMLVFFVAGLRRWSARWRIAHALRWYLVGLLCLDVYALFGVLVPHYYLG